MVRLQILALLAASIYTFTATDVCHAESKTNSELKSNSIQVGDATRDYLVAVPANAVDKGIDQKDAPKSTPPVQMTDALHPLVFVWHGHGGNMRHSGRTFRIHELWPEAVVIYGQGLPTPGMTDPEGKKNGWQKTVGDQNDRDLNYFDALLKVTKLNYKIDDSKIYSLGHSNGAAFTYLLAMERPNVFAAIAPSAAPARGVRLQAVLQNSKSDKVPELPVFHIAGTNDNVVPYKWQTATIEAFKTKNQCDEDGKPWEKKCTLFESKINKPVVIYEHGGGHKYPEDAPELIVKFFKLHSK